MTPEEKKALQQTAVSVREGILTSTHGAKAGHPGGSLSAAEVFTYLYGKEMRVDPKNPRWEDRDRCVLSKGHCTPTTYSALALRGFFPVEDLKTFRKIDSNLSGHIEMKHVPGVDMSAGSLGQGLSVATGMALAGKTDGKNYRVYAITGDGEIEEGQIWEAAMAAAHFKLDNLVLFVDNNQLQLDGAVSEVMSVNPIDEKFRAFGWNAINADGNDVEALNAALDEAEKVSGKPTVIVCHTVKGKGVSIFEGGVKWHGGRPTAEEYKTAYAELDARIAELEG